MTRGRYLLLGLAWLLAVFAVAFGIWSVLHAPSIVFAFAAVLASEMAAWLCACTAVSLGISGILWSRGVRSARFPFALAMLGFASGAWPLISVGRTLAELNLSLPWQSWLAIPTRPPPVRVVTQRFTATLSGPLELDVDVPRLRKGPPAPSILVLHGGAWNRGRRSEVPSLNAVLAASGHAVFDADYRLAAQPNFRAAIADVRCALAWIHQHAPEFGGDPDRVVLLGRSAGAHLALLAAYTSADSQIFDSTCEGDRPRVVGVVSLYGPTDLSWGYDHPANQRVIDGPGTLRAFLAATPTTDPALYALASPITHVSPASPPTLLLQGGRDAFVRPENASRLEARLTRAGVRTRAVLLPWAQHGFDFAPGPGRAIAQAEVLQWVHSVSSEPPAKDKP